MRTVEQLFEALDEAEEEVNNIPGSGPRLVAAMSRWHDLASEIQARTGTDLRVAHTL